MFSQPSLKMLRYRRFLDFLGLFSLIALCLVPLIIDPGARDDSFFTPKWAWIALTTLLGLASVVAGMLAGRPAVFPFNHVWIALLAFTLWHWIAVFWGQSFSLGVERAMQITWLTLAFWVGVQTLTRRRTLAWMGWILVALGVITALWVLTEDAVRVWMPHLIWITPNLPDWRGYISAGLGNTSHIGDLLALAFLPALIMFGSTRKPLARGLLAGVLVLLPAGMIICYSVGAIFGLLAGAVLMLAMVLWHDRGRWFLRRKGRWIVMVVLWAATIGFFVTDHPANPHRPGILDQGFSSERWKEGGSTRLAIWAQTLGMIQQHSLSGVGTGNFTYVFPEMDSPLLWDRPDLHVYQGSWTNAVHNEILQTWAELGIGGLALLLVLGAVAFQAVFKDLYRADEKDFQVRMVLAGLLTAFFVQSMMNFNLQHPAGALTFWGILLAITVEQRTRRAEGGMMPPLRWETDWLALRVDWQTMRRPTALGLAFLLPETLARVLGLALLCLAVAWVPQALRPVLAQREYRRAVEAPLPSSARTHFERALELDANATGCRSRFSAWLVEQGQYEESLDQLAEVRKRLNSNELWMRQAQALVGLKRPQEAQAAAKTYYERVWIERQRRANQSTPFNGGFQ